MARLDRPTPRLDAALSLGIALVTGAVVYMLLAVGFPDEKLDPTTVTFNRYCMSGKVWEVWTNRDGVPIYMERTTKSCTGKRGSHVEGA